MYEITFSLVWKWAFLVRSTAYVSLWLIPLDPFRLCASFQCWQLLLLSRRCAGVHELLPFGLLLVYTRWLHSWQSLGPLLMFHLFFNTMLPAFSWMDSVIMLVGILFRMPLIWTWFLLCCAETKLCSLSFDQLQKFSLIRKVMVVLFQPDPTLALIICSKGDLHKFHRSEGVIRRGCSRSWQCTS